jgi:hypothetical protein
MMYMKTSHRAAILLIPFLLCPSVEGALVGFETATSYPVGTNPRDLALGDFNNDGKLDLATVNNGNADTGDDGNISLLLGNGDGTFQPAINVSTGKNPTAMAPAGFNRDGNADLVFIDGSGVGVSLGNGNGTFGPATYVPTADGPLSLAVADLDGDNKSDLIVGGTLAGSVLLGNGDGSFQTHVDYDIVGSSVVDADVNADGKLDIVIAGFQSQLFAVLLGNGDGTFQNAVPLFRGLSVGKKLLVADFNTDTKPDLAIEYDNVLADVFGSVYVYQGNGDGTFHERFIDFLNSFGGIAAADFNGDSKIDVVQSSIANVFSLTDPGTSGLFLGNGDGTFQPVLKFAGGLGPGVGFADFNQDKANDLAFTHFGNNTAIILLNAADAEFSIAVSPLDPAIASRGQTSTSTVTMKHLNEFDKPVALTCSVEPAQLASCSLDSNSVTFDANGNATATLTVRTEAASAMVNPSFLPHGSQLLRFFWLPVAGFALLGVCLGFRTSTKKRLVGLSAGSVLLCGLISQAACSGGSGPPSSGPHSTTYSITVTGTSGSTQQSTTASLTVS